MPPRLRAAAGPSPPSPLTPTYPSQRALSAKSPSFAILDALGRLVGAQHDGLNGQVFTYDARGRLATVVKGGRVRSLGYDSAGLVAFVTDPLSRSTSLTRDAAGRVVSQVLPGGKVVTLGYDASGRLASLTPPDHGPYRWTHSPSGQLTQAEVPAVTGGGTNLTAFGYDADGRLASVTRPDGAGIALLYDDAGRTREVTFPGGALAYAYDPASGRLASASGPASEQMAFEYDGLLARKVTWSGEANGQVSWGFDKALKLVWEAVGESVVGYAYDNDGLLTKAGAMTLTPQATTGLLSATALGSVTDATTYDAFGARATYTAKFQTTTLLATSYTRDALGRITATQDTVAGQTHAVAYGYDARGRLTDVTTDGVTTAHCTYDANGNRTSLTTAQGTRSATYDAQDRLLSDGTFTYAYGPNGERISKVETATGKTTTYAYDALGNLTHIKLPSGRVLDYVVDAAGRRVAKKVNGQLTQQWLYRDTTRPVAELDSVGNLVRRFVYADNDLGDTSALTSLRERLGLARSTPWAAADAARPLYIVRGTQLLRVVTDHLGSPRLVVDAATGTVVQSVAYDAWGSVTSASGTDLPLLGFAGGLYDPDTGLVRFGARDYDPATGRFTAQEPLKVAGVLNLYEYAGGDPVNQADRDGLALVEGPEKRALLDSMCGPNAEGEIYCTERTITTVAEQAVSELGVSTAAATDSTAYAVRLSPLGTTADGSTFPGPMSTGGPSPTGGSVITSAPTGGSTDLAGVTGASGAWISTGPVYTGTRSAPVNTPPTVSVGPSNTLSVTLPSSGVTLSGSASDAGVLTGYPLQVLWFTQSGPADAVFSDEARAQTTAYFPVGGVYTLVLAANNGEYTSTATLTVTVFEAPTVTVPTAPAFVTLGETATLVGTATTPVLPVGVPQLTTTWSQVSGPGSVLFTAPSQLTTGALFSAPGTYVLRLTATDGTRSGFADVALTVVQQNQAPVVTAGPNQTLQAPTMSTTLVGSASDDGLPLGSTLAYAWSVLSAPAAVTFADASAPTTAATFAYPGTYVLRLAVSDSQKSAAASVVVTVAALQGAVPIVSLGGLTDDAVVTKPMTVTGTVSVSARS